MDLISNRTIEITKLGMDGLMDRQHAIASNIANVMTPDFQRKEVAFESQLAEIIEKEDLKDYIKGQNSIEYKPPMVDVFTGDIHTYRTPTRQEKAYLQSNTMSEFRPQVVTDIYSGSNSTGNNVELEREMMDLSKTGTKYTVLSNLERRQFSLLSDAIRGQQCTTYVDTTVGCLVKTTSLYLDYKLRLKVKTTSKAHVDIGSAAWWERLVGIKTTGSGSK